MWEWVVFIKSYDTLHIAHLCICVHWSHFTFLSSSLLHFHHKRYHFHFQWHCFKWYLTSSFRKNVNIWWIWNNKEKEHPKRSYMNLISYFFATIKRNWIGKIALHAWWIYWYGWEEKDWGLWTDVEWTSWTEESQSKREDSKIQVGPTIYLTTFHWSSNKICCKCDIILKYEIELNCF